MKKLLTVFVLFCLSMSACSRVDSQQQTAARAPAAPGFALGTIDGKSIDLYDTLKTRKAVLVFWTTWCPYCVQEIPDVQAYHDKNGAKVAVIGINIQESSQKVGAFVQKHGMTYPVAMDTDGRVASLYNVRGIPAVVAIDQDGRVVYSGHDIRELANKSF